MIVHNLRLVRWLAGRYTGSGVSYEDLVQKGTLGLMRAVEKFDQRRELRFSTYAIWWIRRSLLDAIRDARVIRIPAGAARRMAAVGATGAPHVSASLDEPVDDGASILGELIADDAASDPIRLAEEAETRRQLRAVLRLLPERHRQVLARRYGLVGDRVQTHKQIGALLGVGEERSRQLEREALHRLRELGERVPHAA